MIKKAGKFQKSRCTIKIFEGGGGGRDGETLKTPYEQLCIYLPLILRCFSKDS